MARKITWYYKFINYIFCLNEPTSLGPISSPIGVHGIEEGTLQRMVHAFPVLRIRIAGRNTATGRSPTKLFEKTPLWPQTLFFYIFIADGVLPRLHLTNVRDYRPTVGTCAIRLFHRFPGGHFPDITECWIPMQLHYAIEGLFSRGSTVHLFLNSAIEYRSFIVL